MGTCLSVCEEEDCGSPAIRPPPTRLREFGWVSERRRRGVQVGEWACPSGGHIPRDTCARSPGRSRMAESPELNSLVGLVEFGFPPALATMRSRSCRNKKKMRCMSWDATHIDETVQRLRGIGL